MNKLILSNQHPTDETHQLPILTFPQFQELPAEVRDLIWEQSLPGRRVFHVKGSIPVQPGHGTLPLKRFVLHIEHKPPVFTRICRESRALSLRKGFFFGKDPSLWFNPDRDLLYMDRNQRQLMRCKDGASLYRVDGLERVKHVGIEWRAWFRDIPPFEPEENMQQRWKSALRSLTQYMPHLETINFVLPQTRYCGGMSFGREPYGAWRHPCELILLPDHVGIPWGKTTPPGWHPTVSFPPHQLSMRLSSWEVIRKQMVKSLEVEAAEEQVDELGHAIQHAAMQQPEVLGWWLIRVGEANFCNNPEVRTFRS